MASTEFIDSLENKMEQRVSWLLNHMYAVMYVFKNLQPTWVNLENHWFSEPV